MIRILTEQVVEDMPVLCVDCFNGVNIDPFNDKVLLFRSFLLDNTTAYAVEFDTPAMARRVLLQLFELGKMDMLNLERHIVDSAFVKVEERSS